MKRTSGQPAAFNYDGAGNRLNMIRIGIETKYMCDTSGRLHAVADGKEAARCQHGNRRATLIAETRGNERIVFVREKLKERGHFTNRPTLRPIKRVELFSKGFSIQKGKKTFTYSWDDVKRCSVEVRIAHKSYGAAGGKYVQKTILLETADELFKIDISSNFPDFRYGDILLRELQKHLGTRIPENTVRSAVLDTTAIVMIVILALVFLVMYGLRWMR